jgi:hypothetical protein
MCVSGECELFWIRTALTGSRGSSQEGLHCPMPVGSAYITKIEHFKTKIEHFKWMVLRLNRVDNSALPIRPGSGS